MRNTEKVQSPWTIRTLRNAMFLLVVYVILILGTPVHDMLWGSHSLMPQLNFAESPLSWVILILHQSGYDSFYLWFFASIVIGLILYLWKGWRRISTLMVWLGIMVLFNRAYLMLVGGNYLLQSLIFFLIFADERILPKGRNEVVGISMTNLALWACRIQVIVVYIFSAGYKWASAQWRSGEAVFDILHLKEFSHPLILTHIDDFHLLCVMANYTALAYFSLFPFLVWSKRWKLGMLFFGVVIHLGMGWAIGVMDFSLIMIGSYIAFIERSDIERLGPKLPWRTKVFET